MTRLRSFLLGVLSGQLILFAAYKAYPVIQADVVPVTVFEQSIPPIETLKMYRVPDWDGKKRSLTINIASPYIIQNSYRIRYPNDERNVDNLLGFYDPDLHVIWTPRDVRILVHELRHVFEGRYHR